MNEKVSQYWERVLQSWKQISKSQKIMFVSILVFVFLTMSLLVYYMTKTEYSYAYTDLNASDAATIKEYLEANGIPYKFNANGTAVGVPTKKVTEVKIDVESQNMLHGGSIGFGIFRDNVSSLGMTNNQFDVLYADGRSGEIEKLINANSGVVKSKVLLDIPKQSLFLNTDGVDEATAAVVITFKPGFKVTQPFVDTIYNLVAKSVTNLPLENITIINSEDGEMLPSSKLNGGMESHSTAATAQFQIKKQYEADIQRNIDSFLSKVFDPDKVIVNVVATLNFDQKNSVETLFTPVIDQSGIARSISEIQKSYSSEGGDASGVVGTGDGDVPGYPSTFTNSGTVNSEEIESIVNFEVNEIKNSIISSPFVVEDLSISVGLEPFIADDPSSLTEETKSEIKAMLVNIVGASLANSGKHFNQEEMEKKVSVIAHPFYGKRAGITESPTFNYLSYLLIGVSVLFAAAAGYYIALRRRRKALDSEEIEPLEREPSSIEPVDIASFSDDNKVRKQLESLATKKPDEFVNLLRTWLIEE